MKLLVNDKELASYLTSLIDLKEHLSHIELNESNTSNVAGAIGYILLKKEHPKFELAKFRQKFKDKIANGVTNDLNNWRHEVLTELKQLKSVKLNYINKNTNYIINNLGDEQVIKNYLKSNKLGFIKTVGQQLTSNSDMIRRSKFNDATQDCLFRNTVGNEQILIDKIDNKYPFWFIDSGYTNFLESNKKWHRLVRNHLHFNSEFTAPADRLSIFPSFPRSWRKTGSKILIVEPGPIAASIFHTDHTTWGEQVTQELKKYTDRPIEIRSKINKKIRTSLYQKLMTEDYYCTISINSNSAVESVWAGIPAITLDKHVSNSVTVNKLKDIDNLYYGDLGNWLCRLSYSQFTFDELMNGTAVNIIRNYHGVTD